MDKRAYSLVVSPNKPPLHESNKKFKVSKSPIKENNGNSINQSLDELDGLCFDDDEEFLQSVSEHFRNLLMIS
jgi:hypothetical protein